MNILDLVIETSVDIAGCGGVWLVRMSGVARSRDGLLWRGVAVVDRWEGVAA